MCTSQGNALAELRIIRLSQISPDQRPIDKHEMRYGARGTYQEAAVQRGAMQPGGSQAASSWGSFATGLIAAMRTSQVRGISRLRSAAPS
jgi:hypothetical protein